jgi:hypothetical protein
MQLCSPGISFKFIFLITARKLDFCIVILNLAALLKLFINFNVYQ